MKRFIKGLVGEYLVLDIIKDMEIIVIVSWTYWKKKVHSFQALKELPREITQVATKFGIAEFELATVVVKDTLECVR